MVPNRVVAKQNKINYLHLTSVIYLFIILYYYHITIKRESLKLVNKKKRIPKYILGYK